MNELELSPEEAAIKAVQHVSQLTDIHYKVASERHTDQDQKHKYVQNLLLTQIAECLSIIAQDVMVKHQDGASQAQLVNQPV